MPDGLQTLLTGAGVAIAPLRDINTADKAVRFFRRLGYEIPAGAFGPALPALAAAAGALSNASITLGSKSGDDIADAIFDAIDKLRATIEAVKALHVEIRAGGGGSLPAIGDLTRRLTDFLVLDYLSVQRPEAHGVLHVLGLIESEPEPAPGQPTFAINWARFSQLINEPARIANDVYKWDSAFDTALFLQRLEAVMRAGGLRGGFYGQSDTTRAALGNTAHDTAELRFPVLQKGLTPDTYSQFGITFSPADAVAGKKKGFAILPYLMGTAAFDFGVCERGELHFESTGEISGIGVALRPPFTAEALLGFTGATHAELAIREKKDKTEELILIGSKGGSRLAMEGLGIRWYLTGAPGAIDLGVEGEAKAFRLVIDPGEGDGFIQKVLSGVKVNAEAALALGMSLSSGFTFRGGARLGLEIGTHLDIGPIKIEGVRLTVAPTGQDISLDTGLLLRFQLGPLKAVAENIGLRTSVRFEPGNIGPADLSIKFKPPDGVGLSLDAGGFKGGGFLRLDLDKGEYAGALELDFKGIVSVKAIGVINTKMPDGSEGFSLLILISAEFTPIQLSFGFTLNGVGGIIGLNRSIVVPALVEGIRTNSIKSILFPEDVVANFSRIVSDIQRFFPPEDGHFVIGPMLKLGWGTPPIVTLELGLLLDLPDPMIAIVGVLRAVLPNKDAPILSLQVNFIGVLDFEHGYVFFRADLYDSRLLFYTITGSMAFLVSWGDQKTFALSVGGFHPDFRDIPSIPALPDAFSNMARIGLSLLSDDNPRLKVESYFAVTSNTVQFGARVELYAAAAGFNIYGFVGYDVLFQFEPFRFVARLDGGVALRRKTSVIAAISVSAKLSGPTPWDADGKASLSLLFFDVSVGFHVTWGDPPPALAKDSVDLLLLLKTELADSRNWRADLPPNNHLHVTLKKLDPPKPADPLVIHPAGVVSFSQRSMPLEDYLIEKVGNKRPLSDNKFKLTKANSNGKPIGANFQETREEFAPGEYSNLSDSDKLSRRSFERLPSGFALTATSDLVTPMPVTRDVTYELSYLRRKEHKLDFRGLLKLPSLAFARLVRAGAVRASPLSLQQRRASLNRPPEIRLPDASFTIAGVDDLKPHGADGKGTFFRTEAEAYQHQRELMRQNPALAGTIQVVSSFELNSQR